MLKLFFRAIAAVLLLVTLTIALPLPAHATPTKTMSLAALPIVSNFMKGQRPSTLGVKDGKLAPCPKSPNCVVSQGQEGCRTFAHRTSCNITAATEVHPPMAKVG